MYQRIRKLVRPNLDTTWVDPATTTDPEHVKHYFTNYIHTGKEIFRNSEDDITGLERTETVLWASKEVWDEFAADPVMQDMRDAHSQNLKDAGILSENISEYEI
jgi:hypothetical protein